MPHHREPVDLRRGWLAALQIGSPVIIRYGAGVPDVIVTVQRITPTGRIVLSNGDIYSDTGWRLRKPGEPRRRLSKPGRMSHLVEASGAAMEAIAQRSLLAEIARWLDANPDAPLELLRRLKKVIQSFQEDLKGGSQ